MDRRLFLVSLMSGALVSPPIGAIRKNNLFGLDKFLSSIEEIDREFDSDGLGAIDAETIDLYRLLREAEKIFSSESTVSSLRSNIINDYLTDRLVLYAGRYVSKTEMCIYKIKRFYA